MGFRLEEILFDFDILIRILVVVIVVLLMILIALRGKHFIAARGMVCLIRRGRSIRIRKNNIGL